MKTITIINKFGPVSNAVTGQNAREIADFLTSEGFEVRFISLKADYLSAKTGIESVLPYEVKELKSVYTGRSPAIRFVSGLIDGFRLWVASLSGKSSAVIVMTDPPLLFLWFQLFRRFSKRMTCYWTMDLYPEAFVAGKYIGAGNIIYRLFNYIVYRKTPDLTIALGHQQYEYLKTKFKKDFPVVIIPCGIIESSNPSMPKELPSGKITFGYGGNIGEAHDANFLIELAAQLDAQKHEMIVSLYGAKAEEVKRVIVQHKHVHFRDFLNRDDIAAMDVNIATLLPEWDHICVPSKAVTAICSGSPLLLNASTRADNWQMFREATWLVEAGGNYDLEITRSLVQITRESIAEKKIIAGQLAKEIIIQKHEALRQLAGFLKNNKGGK